MQQKRVYSRIDILAIILLACMAVFVLRLFWLQVIKHDEYVEYARQSQQDSFVIPATRGEIYMMDNENIVPVVLNQAVYTVIADPKIIKNEDKTDIVDRLRDVAGGEISGDPVEQLNRDSRYEVLARNITRSQAEKLKKYDFLGIGFQRTSIRNYPEGQLAAHVLGFVNADGDGQYGVEQQLNSSLKGTDGLLQSVTDIRKVPLTIGKDNIKIEPEPGQNIVLSIDRNIQNFTEEALKTGIEKAGATEGSLLVMNPNSGEILAMANYPTFSPSEYYLQKDSSVYVNSTTMKPYEPASVIKTFTLATGIDKGVINPQSTYENTDRLQVADRVMENALKGYAGVTTMQQVLNNSFNTGTITVARLLGNGKQVNLQARQTMYEYFYNKFGLGKNTGIELAEAAGYIYPPDSVEGNEVRYSAMTFGQSLNLTMIQVAAGFSSVVNGGEYFKPTLLSGKMAESGEIDRPEKKPLRRTVSEAAASQMQEMLTVARSSSWMSKEDKPGYTIGGKTGTAETVSDSGAYTKSETVGTYLGFGGTDKPEYVIMVRVAAPGQGKKLEGGVHAGPIFSDVSNKMIEYMKLAPRR